MSLDAAKAELARRQRIAAAQAELQRRQPASGEPAPAGGSPVMSQVRDNAAALGQSVLDAEPLTPDAQAALQQLSRERQVPGAGVAGEIVDGVTLGFGDEAMAGMRAASQVADKRPIDERYGAALTDIRAGQSDFQEQHPVAAGVARVAGAIASPVAKLAGPVNSVRGAAMVGGATAATEGFAEGEGGLSDRGVNAAKSAPAGALFGGLVATLGKGASKGLKRVFKRAEQRPSIETLKAAKNAAYKAVRDTGETFGSKDTNTLYARIQQLAVDADFDDIADPQSAAALRMMKTRSGAKLSLDRLDRLRQNLWDRYGRSDEPLILDMIGEIDNLIDTRAASSDAMRAARQANSKYAKAQLLENAFKKARLQTASTGSGGNILNKYRQAVTRIITTPKEAKWFSADELAIMEKFVEGDVPENVLRRIGKVGPGGNGLMTALNVYAAAVDPTMLAVSAVGAAAKEGADKSAMRGSEAILDAVATGVIAKPKAAASVGRAAVGAGVGANALSPF